MFENNNNSRRLGSFKVHPPAKEKKTRATVHFLEVQVPTSARRTPPRPQSTRAGAALPLQQEARPISTGPRPRRVAAALPVPRPEPPPSPQAILPRTDGSPSFSNEKHLLNKKNRSAAPSSIIMDRHLPPHRRSHHPPVYHRQNRRPTSSNR